MEYTMTPPSGEVPLQSVVTYAGFWRRTGAYLLDDLIISSVCGAVFVVLMLVAVGAEHSGMPDSGVSVLAGTGFLLYILASTVGGWLYYALMESSKNGATLGKMAFGLRVTDTNGSRISFGRATGRYFGKIVSSIILGFGFFMVGWTSKKQGLHDMMAETIVLRKGVQVPRSIAANAFPESTTTV